MYWRSSPLRPYGNMLGVFLVQFYWYAFLLHLSNWIITPSQNVLTGTLLPPVLATLLQTSLTTLGSVLSTILATPLTPIITRFFPSAIELTRSALEGPSSGPSSSSTSGYPPSTSPSVLSSSTTLRDSISTRPSTPTSFSPINPKEQQQQSNTSPWARLAVLRLIGIVPWSGINVACGVCGVSLRHCATGAFIGTLPWTAVTCQVRILSIAVVFVHLADNA